MLQVPKLYKIAVKVTSAVAVKISRIVDDIAIHFDNSRSNELNLLILDDYFPSVLSAFRIAEYNYYLENIPGTEVHSVRESNHFFRSAGSYQEKLTEYLSYYPRFKSKIRRFNKHKVPNSKLAYTVFINNAYYFIEYIDKHKIPFMFTLYPGGGFGIDDTESDKKLRRVLSSPNFKKVFVTQKISRQYLIDKNYCHPSSIEFIYGCVLPSEQLSRLALDKLRFKTDKSSFDICFVAAKYTKRGVDKGYDVFIEVAKQLCGIYEDINFHVVGSFDTSDIDVASIQGRITFYGLRNTDFFPKFYSKMDIILSPNVPFVLAPGAFDGFPTASCMEAGLSGVAVFCSDPLDQNVTFNDREEIVIISKKSAEIADVVIRYYNNPKELYQLAEKGKKAFQRTFDVKTQMSGRMRILRNLINSA